MTKRKTMASSRPTPLDFHRYISPTALSAQRLQYEKPFADSLWARGFKSGRGFENTLRSSIFPSRSDVVPGKNELPAWNLHRCCLINVSAAKTKLVAGRCHAPLRGG